MAEIPTRLGQILLARQTISKSQLNLALEYQASHGEPIGECLLTLGFIDKKTLSRALRRQSWLKPCAAYLTCLCAPFTLSTCFANDIENDFTNDQWAEEHSEPCHKLPNKPHLHSEEIVSIDVLAVAAEAAWGIYQGEPEAGDLSYSVSKFDTGYSVSMKISF